MRDALLIAKREYLEQVKSRTFKLTTVLIPLIFAVIIAIFFFTNKNSGVGKHLTIASNDTVLANDVRDRILEDKAAKTTVDVVAPAAPADRETLRQKVETKQLDGFLWLEAEPGATPKATYESRSAADFVTTERIRSAVNPAVMQERLRSKGLSAADAEALTKKVAIDTRQVKNGKATHSDAMSSFMSAYIMSLLLTMTCMMYGMNVGRSVIQEKTSRVFEVMLASVQARDLLAGKLIGVGAVGLTQLGIWIVAAALLSSSSLAVFAMSGGIQLHASVFEIILFCLYFLLGYLLYSSIFAGLAATIESEQEMQQYAPLAAIPVWISFSMITFIMSDPNSIWSIAISMFPLCAPITMFLRIASQFPPLWQIGLSIFIMIASIWLVLLVSSKIYRVGILMYGKRATLPEILRWIRYS